MVDPSGDPVVIGISYEGDDVTTTGADGLVAMAGADVTETGMGAVVLMRLVGFAVMVGAAEKLGPVEGCAD